jgi:ribosomal protein S21
MVTDRMRAFKERPTGRTARRVAEAARRRASQQRMAARGTLPGKARS